MAWRLDKSIVRGEIDNRQRGRVVGRIWLVGRDDPVLLSLEGNCWPDLAGTRLTFENPEPASGDHVDLNEAQDGVVGDMTASRKVRILDTSIEKALELGAAHRKIPEHMGNGLYLEWYSDTNGRVVIESAAYDVQVSEHEWSMSPEEELGQAEASQKAMRQWMNRLDEALATQDERDSEAESDWHMDEFQWERFMKKSDQRTDKYMELMDEYREHPDRERIIARKMGWDWLEEALDADEKGVFDVEKANAEMEEFPPLIPNPLTEGTDWIRTERGDICHPLAHRAHEISIAMWHDCDDLGLVEDSGDEDVQDMVFHAQTLSTKLAGALNGLAYDEAPDGGFVVAYLKRALTCFDQAIAASKKVREKNVLTAERLDQFCNDLFAIREDILKLMQKYRQEPF